MSYTYFLQRARVRYRAKRLVLAGTIPFIIIWVLLSLVIGTMALFSGEILVAVLGVFGSFFLSIIYSWLPSTISCGVYYLISNYGLENKIFRTVKFEMYEKQYMLKALNDKQLSQEQYDLYLEKGNEGIIFTS